jgi:hypothetical protein
VEPINARLLASLFDRGSQNSALSLSISFLLFLVWVYLAWETRLITTQRHSSSLEAHS